MESFGRSIRASYDRVAADYAGQFFDELSRKPFDRDLLESYADLVRKRGLVCDLGCGPGQIARHLKDRGVSVCGLDLSGELLAQARRLNPDIPLAQGDMLALPLADHALAGIVAFYSIIHLHRKRVPDALRELYRVLAPGGWLLLAFHGGEGETRADQWFGKPVSLEATFFTGDEMRGYLARAGFASPQIQTRDTYPFESAGQRVYGLAQRPAPRRKSRRRL